MSRQSRRSFLKETVVGGALLGLSPRSHRAIFAAEPPSERVRIGMIGVGNQGGPKNNMKYFLNNIVALCDLDRNYLAEAGDFLQREANRPAVMTDERGNMAVFRTISGDWMERLERAAAVEFGGAASSAEFSLTAAEARGATVRNSVSKAIRIGEALAGAKGSPVAALMAEMGAFQLITGKVMDVERHTTSGFVRGSVVIEGLDEDAGRLVRLELQNENLVALERGRVLASVPDLITVVDSETADAIASEVLRYGQRVTVIAFACDPVWRTERGIAVAGPRAFGYDFDYLPVEERTDARA